MAERRGTISFLFSILLSPPPGGGAATSKKEEEEEEGEPSEQNSSPPPPPTVSFSFNLKLRREHFLEEEEKEGKELFLLLALAHLFIM